MKLKYYMRGVGTGILVTALILLIVKEPKELSDAEIKIRAAALGMVEESTFSDEGVLKSNKEEQKDIASEEVKKDSAVEEVPKETEEEETESAEIIEEKNQEETLEQDPEDPKLSQENEPEESIDEDKEVQYVSITIESGDVAKTVSEKLYEAGLIESAVEYSNFLSGNNYSYRLRAGYYEIPVGADHHQIAEILCKIAEE